MIQSAPYEWLRRSRTLLYDAYWPPFYPELAYTARRGVEVAKRLHADVIRFGTIGKWALFQSRIMPRHPELGKRDLLRDTVELGQRAGMRTVAYMPVGHGLPGSWVSKRRPEWRFLVDGGKSPEGICHFGAPALVPICTVGPYREAILAIAREIVLSYDIDGLYLDGPYQGWIWDKHACQCNVCRKKFKADTGLPLPTNAQYANTAKDLQVRRLVAAHRDWVATGLIELLSEIRAIAKSRRDLPIMYNGCATEYLPGDRQDELIAQADGFLMESHRGGIKGVGRGIHYRKLVWNYTHRHSAWPRRSTPRLEEENALSGYVAVAQGATPIVSYAGRFLVSKDGNASGKYAGPIRDLFSFIEKNKSRLESTKVLPYAALISDLELKPSDAFEERPRFHHDAHLYGAWNMLADQGIQATVLPKAILRSEKELAAYALVILPSIPHLGADELTTLTRYVENGGGLLITGETSLYDAAGKKLNQLSLASLIGADLIRPAGALKKDLDFHWWGQIHHAWDLYLRPRRELGALTVDPEGNLIAPNLLPLKTRGARVLADLVTGSTGKSLLPAVLEHSVGKGTVVAIAGAVEKTYAENDRDAGLSDLMNCLVARVASRPIPVRVRGAGELFVHLAEKSGKRYLHLVDENLSRTNVAVDLDFHGGNNRGLRISSLVSGKRLVAKAKGKRFLVTGYGFSRHDCLEIDWEE